MEEVRDKEQRAGKTLPAMKFDGKLGLRLNGENGDNESQSTENTMISSKLPPLNNRDNRRNKLTSNKKRKKKKKSPRRDNLVPIETYPATILEESIEEESDQQKTTKVIVTKNKNATEVVNVDPVSSLENIKYNRRTSPVTKHGNTNVSDSDDPGVTSTMESTSGSKYHDDELCISTTNSNNNQNGYILKQENPMFNTNCGETEYLCFSEDGSTTIINNNSDRTDLLPRTSYSRDIALAPVIAKREMKRTSKSSKSNCDFVLVHDVYNKNFEEPLERASFEAALKKDGIDVIKTTIGENVFVQLYASFDRLCKEAESIYLHMDLEGSRLQHRLSIFDRVFRSMKTDTQFDRISAPFTRSSRDIFLGINNRKTFFRSAYRSMLVRNILKNTKVCLSDEAIPQNSSSTSSIDSLLHSGLYKSAFILHDRSEYDTSFPPPQNNSIDIVDSRRDLHNTWLRCTKWQPLWKIRNYFGEKIGFYFAWLGMLITALWIPTLLGIGVFVYGIISLYTSNELVQISELKRWAVRGLDNDLTPYYALIVCLWGTVFIEFWKRKRAELAYKWDVDSFEEHEPNRPQFYGTKLVKDPVTGIPEPYYPLWRKVLKSMGSYGIVLFMIVLVVASVISVVIYKVVARVDFFATMSSGTLASSFTSSILNSASILVLGKLYKWLAYRLTDWENHRTRTLYEDALIMKLFGFEFVNSYCSLFYIAFFRAGTASDQGILNLGAEYSDTCGKRNDCMSELTIQVAVLMIVKPMPKLLADIILPFTRKHILNLWHCLKRKRALNVENDTEFPNEDLEYERYLEAEYKKPPLGNFTLTEYTEKVLQYGYILLFAAAFPLAPVIALITNLIDLRVDAGRMLWFNQRPVPERAQDIGMWLTILSFLNYAGMITNAFILGITSRYGRSYQTRIYDMEQSVTPGTNSTVTVLKLTASDNAWIILIFENVVLAVKVFLEYVIPDVSRSVSRAKVQEKRQLQALLSQSGNIYTCGPGKSIRKNSTGRIQNTDPVVDENRTSIDNRHLSQPSATISSHGDTNANIFTIKPR